MSDGRSIDLYLLSLSPKSRPACDLDLLQCHAGTVLIVQLKQYQQYALCTVLPIFVVYRLLYSCGMYPLCVYPCYLGAGAEEMYPPALLVYYGGRV